MGWLPGWPVLVEVGRLVTRGGPVMIPLLACSVLALAIVFERAWTWWRLAPPTDADQVLIRAARGDWDEAIRAGEASRSPVARVLAAGLRHRHPAPALAMEAAALAEVGRLKRHLPLLDTIVTLSPLLGLLGTVTGMISAFGVMAQTGVNEPHALTGGVAEALLATATGLAVAIVALVPYNLFNARIEELLEAVERYGSQLELMLAEAGRLAAPTKSQPAELPVAQPPHPVGTPGPGTALPPRVAVESSLASAGPRPAAAQGSPPATGPSPFSTLEA